MGETPQPVANIALEGVAPSAPQHPFMDATENEELLKKELARLTPPNEKLRALADKSPPPPEWIDDEQELPI